jgi:cytochrome c-type biogenesis protein CcmH
VKTSKEKFMDTPSNPIETIKRQLAQLKELHDSGVMPQAQYDEGKATLERRILDLVLSGEALPATAPTTAPTAASASAPSSASASASTAASEATGAALTAKPSNALVIGLAVGVVAIAAAGYFWKGAPELASGNAPQAQANGEGNGAPQGQGHPTDQAQIAAMVEKLAARLKDKPDDADGWSMLGRSQSVLGNHAEALKAYKKAMDLRKDDAMLIVDYADSLAVNNNRSLDGEPMKLVERALKADPRNLKALFLAGTYAFNKKDYAGAVKQWEKAVQSAPADNAFVQQIQPALAEARQLAGMPPAAAAPLDAALKPASGPASKVSGTVTLAAALAKQANPEDTVFIFARPATGSRMPLAIMRKQVKDLPLEFSLDDSMAMSPASAISGAGQVIVGARISKSGNAVPQPGDLAGQSGVVKVGATGVKIEIKEAVKP